jgi:Flp pilus assembly protein TadG
MRPDVRVPRRRFGLGSDRGGAVRCPRLRGDGGSSAIEFVLLTPAVFFLIFATVQVAMYSFAQDVAKAAAQAAAREARAQADVDPGGFVVKSEQVGRNYISSLAGDGVLGNPQVRVRYAEGSAGTVVRAHVTGQAVSLVPMLTMSVSVSSEGPVERFIPDGG